MTSNKSKSRIRLSIWAARVISALAFGLAGGAKLFGAAALVAIFDQIGFGQWFRYLTGAIELLGAILILVPAAALTGTILLFCVACGAVATHFFLIGGNSLPAIVLLFLTGGLLVATRRYQRLGAL
ncbi:DoxX family protein [Novosphingopyxis sp.]|uniref:DoxX family protein n=1 Tax=Novosphingopyxis sp. TaxID=2709690 RepID=UPI003B5AA464